MDKQIMVQLDTIQQILKKELFWYTQQQMNFKIIILKEARQKEYMFVRFHVHNFPENAN